MPSVPSGDIETSPSTFDVCGLFVTLPEFHGASAPKGTHQSQQYL
jgi:hypothetical protein